MRSYVPVILLVNKITLIYEFLPIYFIFLTVR